MNDPDQDPRTPRVGVVEVFTKTGCRPCKQTLRWLRKHGVAPDVYPAKEFFDVLVPLGIRSAPGVLVYGPDGALVDAWGGFDPARLAHHFGAGAAAGTGVAA